MKPDLKTKTLGVVLAGGKSSRFGEDKSFFKLAETPLWLRSFEIISPLVNEVVISHNSPARFPGGYRVITDQVKNQGPLGGIYSVLNSVEYELYLFCAVDLPLIKTAVLETILNQAEDYDVVAPYLAERLHPLLARYKYTCLPLVKKQLALKELKVTGFFDLVKVKLLTEDDFRGIDPELASFFNLNTQKDLEIFKRLI